MDKDKKIDSLILEMRNINRLNSELLEKLIKEKDNMSSKDKINKSLEEEIEQLKKENTKLRNELIGKNKEIQRSKRHYEAMVKRLKNEQHPSSRNTDALVDFEEKNKVLESLLCHLGKKFQFDGELLMDVYKVVSDPNDDFLRCLVDSIKDSHDTYMKMSKINSEINFDAENV